MTLYKYCGKCKKLKPVSDFHKGGSDGYNSRCKECVNERARKYYARCKNGKSN